MNYEKDCKQKKEKPISNLRKVLVEKDKNDFRFAFRVYAIAFVILVFTPIVFYNKYNQSRLNEQVKVEFTIVYKSSNQKDIIVKDNYGNVSKKQTDIGEIVNEGDKISLLVPKYETEHKPKPENDNLAITLISVILLVTLIIILLAGFIFDSPKYLRIDPKYIDNDDYKKEVKVIGLIKSLQLPILIISIGLYLFALCYGT